MNRSNFLKKACFAGFCFCGFSAVPGFAGNNTSEGKDINKPLNQEWLSGLLANLSQDLEEDVVRGIVKKSAIAHYNDLKMNTLLAEYVGDLGKFCKFLESSWGWKIDYNETTKVLIADENKDYCVCPVLEHKKGQDTSTICYCSEGFAEKMFSLVTGVQVKARVISSVRKGDKSCIYKIELA